VEIVERYGRHHTSNSGRYSFASITDEIVHREEVAALLLISTVNLEGPSVG
jgi:hypothetical protein